MTVISVYRKYVDRLLLRGVDRVVDYVGGDCPVIAESYNIDEGVMCLSILSKSKERPACDSSIARFVDRNAAIRFMCSPSPADNAAMTMTPAARAALTKATSGGHVEDGWYALSDENRNDGVLSRQAAGAALARQLEEAAARRDDLAVVRSAVISDDDHPAVKGKTPPRQCKKPRKTMKEQQLTDSENNNEDLGGSDAVELHEITMACHAVSDIPKGSVIGIYNRVCRMYTGDEVYEQEPGDLFEILLDCGTQVTLSTGDEKIHLMVSVAPLGNPLAMMNSPRCSSNKRAANVAMRPFVRVKSANGPAKLYIAVVATRDVAAGAEILLDYGPDFFKNWNAGAHKRAEVHQVSRAVEITSMVRELTGRASTLNLVTHTRSIEQDVRVDPETGDLTVTCRIPKGHVRASVLGGCTRGASSNNKSMDNDNNKRRRRTVTAAAGGASTSG
jgi:hypothetical protein